jgi:hypothetical protein
MHNLINFTLKQTLFYSKHPAVRLELKDSNVVKYNAKVMIFYIVFYEYVAQSLHKSKTFFSYKQLLGEINLIHH